MLGAGDARVLLTQRHQVHVVVDHDRAAELLAERLPYGEAVPARHDRRGHRHALGEADRSRDADAGAVEALGEPGGAQLRGHGEHLLEDRDRALAHVQWLVDVPEDLQLGVGDGDVDRGRADVDAEEAEFGVEADVVAAAPAARGGESVGHHESGLQQPVHLDGQLGPGEVDLVAQLGTGVGPSVAQQLEQSRLVGVSGSCGHASHEPLPASIGLGSAGFRPRP